jgi:DNA-binding MarR family transcriptional regulator
MPRAGDGAVDEIADAVLLASRALVSVAARSLAVVENEVTLPQFRALVVLSSRGPVKSGELAEELSIHASTATRLCDRLQGKELVTRGPHPDNRREVLLTITEKGQRIVDDVTASRRREIAAIVRRMPQHLRAAMVPALQAFADAAGEVPEQAWSLGWRS